MIKLSGLLQFININIFKLLFHLSNLFVISFLWYYQYCFCAQLLPQLWNTLLLSYTPFVTMCIIQVSSLYHLTVIASFYQDWFIIQSFVSVSRSYLHKKFESKSITLFQILNNIEAFHSWCLKYNRSQITEKSIRVEQLFMLIT